MTGVEGTEDAANRIRRIIRTKLFSLSTLAFARPAVFDRIESQSRREALDRLRQEAKRDPELDELYDSIDADNQRLKKEKKELEATVAALEADLARARENFRLVEEFREDEGDLAPESETPPETVAEAVDAAKLRFVDDLIFGDDVERGVGDLAPSAGPPDSVLKHLSKLAQLAQALKSGSIGKRPIGSWLLENGIQNSKEKPLTRNNKREQQKRTWSDGLGQRRTYEAHTKVNESTGPDRCVRIYFDYDQEAARITIGWVGRHPD